MREFNRLRYRRYKKNNDKFLQEMARKRKEKIEADEGFRDRLKQQCRDNQKKMREEMKTILDAYPENFYLTRSFKEEIERRYELAHPGKKWSIPHVGILRRPPYNFSTHIPPFMVPRFYYLYMNLVLPKLRDEDSIPDYSQMSLRYVTGDERTKKITNKKLRDLSTPPQGWSSSPPDVVTVTTANVDEVSRMQTKSRQTSTIGDNEKMRMSTIKKTVSKDHDDDPSLSHHQPEIETGTFRRRRKNLVLSSEVLVQ